MLSPLVVNMWDIKVRDDPVPAEDRLQSSQEDETATVGGHFRAWVPLPQRATGIPSPMRLSGQRTSPGLEVPQEKQEPTPGLRRLAW